MPPELKTTPAPLSPVSQPGAGRQVVVEAPILEEPDVLKNILEEPEVPKTVLIHILEDGFSAHGQIWYRGQEIEYRSTDGAFGDTKDIFGNSWLDYSDREQMQRWGRIMFRHGSWPGNQYEDLNSLEAEKARGRKPLVLAPVVGGRR